MFWTELHDMVFGCRDPAILCVIHAAAPPVAAAVAPREVQMGLF